MSCTKKVKSRNQSENEKNIDLLTAIKFFENPPMLVDYLNCGEMDTAKIQEVTKYLSGLSDEETFEILPSLATSISINVKNLENVYSAIKDEILSNIDTNRSVANDLKDLLIVVKDNWESIAIIALFLRSLGDNNITFEGGSVFKPFLSLLDSLKEK